jgi:hypothetical protein
MAQTFKYRGFKITLIAGHMLTVQRCKATRGRKVFEGRMGDVCAEIDSYLAAR